MLENANPMKTVLGFATMVDEKGKHFISQKEILLNLMMAQIRLELM